MLRSVSKSKNKMGHISLFMNLLLLMGHDSVIGKEHFCLVPFTTETIGNLKDLCGDGWGYR